MKAAALLTLPLLLAAAEWPPITGATHVTVGDFTRAQAGCFLRTEGTVHCWSGPGVANRFGPTAPLPGPWQVPGIEDAVALGRGQSGQSCAVLRGGGVRCFAGKDVTDPAIVGVV